MRPAKNGLQLDEPNFHAPVDIPRLLQRALELKRSLRCEALQMFEGPQLRPSILLQSSLAIYALHEGIHAAVEVEIICGNQGGAAGLRCCLPARQLHRPKLRTSYPFRRSD